MQTKTFIATISAIIILPIALIIFLNFNTSLSPTQTSLEECKTLQYNNEQATNIVFFSGKEEAEKYSDFLLTISPFDKNKDAFNFYYINSYKPKCEIYKGIAVLCYSKELTKKASSCPNDYLVVLSDNPSNIRSSSYMNTLSINTNHQLTVFPHELGHALANLAEEYTPANIPKGSKNCASSCNEFTSEINECLQGCSQDNYFRSINNGVMRSLSSNDYGIFNENLILQELNKKSKITGFAALEEQNCQSQDYYLVEGFLQDNSITILERAIEQGCVNTNGNGFFEYNLILESGETYLTENFNPELIFTDTQEEGLETLEGEIFASENSFFLKIPIIPNSKTLEILKDNQKLTEINLENLGASFCKVK